MNVTINLTLEEIKIIEDYIGYIICKNNDSIAASIKQLLQILKEDL